VTGQAATLEARGLTKTFGGLRAVGNVSFRVGAGTIKAIIGPNGAGKTTLLNLITRVFRADAGEVWLDGRRIDRLPPYRIVRLGVARTFQNLRLFGEMSVLENVMVGCHCRTGAGPLRGLVRTTGQRREERAIAETAWRLLEDVGLADQAGEPAAALPFGKQRMLEIARVLATEPRLLLLDEPAAGLNAGEAAGLGEFIRRLRLRGMTVVLVEHHMELVMDVSDEILVLEFGETLAEGRPDDIRTHPDVLRAYLGDEASIAVDLRA
jgi:branched-chain amino acid transport system ATP-binding protein